MTENKAGEAFDYKFAEIHGLNIRYIDEGTSPLEDNASNPDGKPTILLLHGWAAPAETYRLIINHLSSRYRVVAPDMPGCGGSDEPSQSWHAAQYVDFVVKFIAKLGLREVILIGHSHGGRTIIKLMSLESREFNVKKIILMDAAGIKPKRRLNYYIKVYSYKLMKRLFPNKAEEMKRKTGSADYRSASPVMRDTLVKLINEDMTGLLKNINVPTLLIWGEKDTATPIEHARIMEREIADAGLVALKGAGHFAFAEKWGQCRLVLDAFI